MFWGVATPHSNERRPSEDGSDSDDDWANDLSSTDGSNDDDRTSSIQQPQGLCSSLSLGHKTHERLDEGVPAYTEEGIHRSIAACQFQLDLPGTRGSPGLVAVLTSAKAGYFKLLYQHFRKVEYLNERIQLCQEVTPLLPKDHPKILECLQGEGESLKYLFERRRRAEDLDRAIELFRRVILLEETHNSFFDLGSALALRARDTGSEADLEEAIQLLEQADKRGLEDDITKGAITLRILGCALHARSRSRDDLAEAERAILILRKGLSMVDDPTLRRRALGDLATVLTEHAEVTQDPRLMDEAIALRRESVSLCSEEAYDYWVFLRGLGQTLSLNHNLVGGLELLEEGITVLRQSFNLMPSHDPDRAHFYHIIGSALINHTRYTGNSQSLVEGIALLQQAVGLRPPGHPLRAKSLGNLATALHDRWEDLGDETDLEDAIRLQEEALQLRPPGHPDRYSCLVSIGISLNHKALLTKDVKSAVSAVDINRSVLDLCPKGHAYHATALQNLAVTLGTLWAMARNVQAVYEAIKIQEEVLELRYKGHPMRYGSLSIMTSLLNDAYKITKNIELLEKAIGFEREALSLYPRGNPNRLTALSIMSFSLRAHFSRTGNPTDAIEALKLGNEFLEETETGDPNRYVALSELVRLYSTRGAPYFNLSKAVGLVLEVLDEPLYHPQRLVRRCMVDLLRIQRRLSEGENLAEEDPRRFMLGLYRKTIELLPRVASFGALSERLNALRDFEKLGEQAVAHALALGKDNYAVEVLESSRAVFWSQALRLRSTYDGVPAHMAEELGQLSRRLESGGIADQDDEGMSRSIETSKTEREEVFKFHKPTEVELKRLGRRFEELVTQVRSMPGLERFLLHDVYERLKRAAIKGVVVILVANSSGCHAIVVKSASPFAQHVPLPGASVERVNKLGQEIRESNLKYLRDVRDVGESAERKSRTSKSIHSTAGGILAGIWGSVVAPIIEHLQLRVRDTTCTKTGQLSRLGDVLESHRSRAATCDLVPHWTIHICSYTRRRNFHPPYVLVFRLLRVLIHSDVGHAS